MGPTKKEIKAFEMMKCRNCGELKDAFGRNLSFCGSCRDDSMKSVIICGACEENEVKDDGELCPECQEAAHEAANEAARENAIDLAIKTRREEGK
jgi:hypothetical protein